MDLLSGLAELFTSLSVQSDVLYAAAGAGAAAVGLFAGGVLGFFVGRKTRRRPVARAV